MVWFRNLLAGHLASHDCSRVYLQHLGGHPQGPESEDRAVEHGLGVRQ